MLYSRKDMCTVVGLAFEYLLQLEQQVRTIAEKERLLQDLECFNQIISRLDISFDELPVALYAKALRYLDGVPRQDGKGIKMPDVGPADA